MIVAAETVISTKNAAPASMRLLLSPHAAMALLRSGEKSRPPKPVADITRARASPERLRPKNHFWTTDVGVGDVVPVPRPVTKSSAQKCQEAVAYAAEKRETPTSTAPVKSIRLGGVLSDILPEMTADTEKPARRAEYPMEIAARDQPNSASRGT